MMRGWLDALAMGGISLVLPYIGSISDGLVLLLVLFSLISMVVYWIVYHLGSIGGCSI